MGKQKTYSWEFKLQMLHLLEKGTHNMSQVSRDYHVTRSLLYAWMRLYQERGEAAFVPGRATQSPPEVERPQNEQEQITYLEALQKQLKVMDSTAFSLCMDNKMPIIVFDLFKPHNLRRVVCGEKVGTLVTA